MIISIDFDGVLHDGNFPAIGSVQMQAAECLRKLSADGHYLIINTCRSDEPLLEAINWLLAQAIPFNRINDNHPENTAKYNSNSRKIYAHCYIDDRNVGGLPPWDEIYRYITERENKFKDY